MKKRILAFLSTLAGLLLLAGTASAQVVITNTGPGSNNTVTSNNSSVCNSTSTNTTQVTNSTQQSSSSGSASVGGNTSGGNATSGNSTNTSSTSTSVTANNSGGCLPGTTNPPGGGSGGSGSGPEGEVLSAQTGGQGGGIASLPETGSAAPAEILAGSLAILSALTLGGFALKQYLGKAI